MGFFKKVFKGIGKVFKKIGKGIKSAFKKFGKFMNKIGILGQVAMFFIMPYVGQALGSMWTGIAGQTAAQGTATAAANVTAQAAGQQVGATVAQQAAGKVATKALAEGVKKGVLEAVVQEGVTSYVATQATGLMASNAVAQGVGHVMQFTANTVGKVGTVFNNITKGVTDTLGNFAKTASNNMFGTSFDAAANFFGPGDSAFGRSFGSESRFQNLTGSENLFETFKEDRIAETEAQLNTKAGQRSMDRTVAESSSDWESFEQGKKEFISDPAYDKMIADGTTNVTASADVNAYMRDPSQMRLDITDIDNTNLLRQEGLSQNVIDNLGVTEFPVERAPSFEYFKPTSSEVFDGINVAPELSVNNIKLPSLDYNVATDVGFDPMSQENFARGMLDDAGAMAGNVNPDKVYQPSLLERMGTGIKNIPERASAKIGEIAADPLGYVGKGMEKRFQSGVQTRLMQEAGILAKPEYNVQNIRNVAYVPSFESFGSSQQQYGAPAIMDARAFEQQVTNNPSPYGYTAFQYGNYMAQYGQTA